MARRDESAGATDNSGLPDRRRLSPTELANLGLKKTGLGCLGMGFLIAGGLAIGATTMTALTGTAFSATTRERVTPAVYRAQALQRSRGGYSGGGFGSGK